MKNNMNMNIDTCEFNIQFQAPIPDDTEVIQRQILNKVLEVVQTVIKAGLGDADRETVTLPDIQLNLPVINLADYQAGPAAYMQKVILPAVRYTLEPILMVYRTTAETHRVTNKPSTMVTQPTTKLSSEESINITEWADIEAALKFDRGRLAVAKKQAIVLIDTCMRRLRAEPTQAQTLRQWLEQPSVRLRLWQACRQGGWATQMPEVLQLLYPQPLTQQLLPQLLTQGLSAATQIALWHTVINVLTQQPTGIALQRSQLIVQSYTIENKSKLIETAYQRALNPFRAWLRVCQTSRELAMAQSWLAVTGIQGARLEDIKGLQQIIGDNAPPEKPISQNDISEQPKHQPGVQSTAATGAITALQTLMALIQQLQQTEGDLQAGAQQVTYIREWLAAQQLHLDTSITQAVQAFLAVRDTTVVHAEPVINEQQGSEIDTGLEISQTHDAIQRQIQKEIEQQHHKKEHTKQRDSVTSEQSKHQPGAQNTAVTGVIAVMPNIGKTINNTQTPELKASIDAQKIIQKIQRQIQIKHQIQAQYNETGYVSQDAGLVLLWPYLKTLFTNVKIIEDTPKKGMQFVDYASKMKAHALLITLLGEEPTTDIWVVANALVGLPLETLVTEPVVITQDEIKQCEKVLTAAITHWKGLKNISINSFRALFLARTATVKEEAQGLRIDVEKHAADVLLSTLPWGIGIIMLPWIGKSLIQVTWSGGIEV